jgi:hypothetical protein
MGPEINWGWSAGNKVAELEKRMDEELKAWRALNDRLQATIERVRVLESLVVALRSEQIVRGD